MLKFKGLFRKGHPMVAGKSKKAISYDLEKPENPETESLRRQLEEALNYKANLEFTLQELIKTHGQLEVLRLEVADLKKQKEEIQNNLLLRIGNVDTIAVGCEGNKNVYGRKTKLPNSAPASIAPQSSESTELLDTPEWDKNSSGSLSEVSVACLQDRIMQMEETHYSTSEELQATLQELADLQSMLSELQNDNDRLGEEKGVLLESLCQQTEKLEDARSKIDALQELLLDPQIAETSFSEREQKLVDLLKNGQDERESLMVKQKKLMNELDEVNRKSAELRQETITLNERTRLLESTVDATNAERRQLEQELACAKEDCSSKEIEIKMLNMMLDNARCKCEELEVAREKQGDRCELDNLIDSLREEKNILEMQQASLQEQLSKSICEVTRLKDQLVHVQEECRVSRNNAKSLLKDMEYKCEKNKEEVSRLTLELVKMCESYSELEEQSQCHLGDKQQLKSLLMQTQQHLAQSDRQILELKRCLEEEKRLRDEENAEWKQFQNDLLMTVRVANDLKTEAQCELQRLVLENKQLRDKIKVLESQIEQLSKVEKVQPYHRSVSAENSSSILSSVMSQEMNRRSTSKYLRQDSRLSVKSLIESIECATKQAKTGHASNGSDPASSLCSITNHIPISTSLQNIDNENSNINSLPDKHESNASYVTGDDHIIPPTSILIHSKNLDFRRSSSNDLSERKDPLQSLLKNGGSRRNALLRWCQRKTVGYVNIDITNFSSSWNDGMALCALLHSYLPHSVPYNELNPSEKRKNFSVAFAAAESVGISTTLNINDMIQEERPDWNLVMAYVTSIFRHFES